MTFRLGFTTLFLSLFFCKKIFACSCADFANAQQAAQSKDVIIAKVETIALSEGKARVRVEKVFKGYIENVYLDVQGQDGLNCNGENIPLGEKGVLLFQKTGEGYKTLSCATTNVRQNDSGLYQVFLGEEFLLNEKELKDVLDFKLQASVKSAECQLTVSRMAVPFDSASNLNFRYDTAVSATPSRGEEVTILKSTVDLAPMAPNVHELFFYSEVKKLDKSNYQFTIRLKDPFTALVLENWSAQLDIRKSLQFSGPNLSRFTDLAGNPMTDSGQPFLAHQTQSFCALNLGKPLEVVK
ncbi:hypothetical protein [Pseudobdellovibrio sp. HCB154]|uniref:hypothetical protein n=1 Tax=Pseudobdellovibrio sp. HCB154 TaxID=3386277 RepID=UPI003916DDD5